MSTTDLFNFVRDNLPRDFQYFEKFVFRYIYDSSLTMGYYFNNTGQRREYTLEQLKNKSKEQLDFIICNLYLMYSQTKVYSENRMQSALSESKAFVYQKLLPPDFDRITPDDDDMKLFTICTHFWEYIKHFIGTEGVHRRKHVYKKGDIIRMPDMGGFYDNYLYIITNQKEILQYEYQFKAFLDFHWEQFNNIYTDKLVYFSEETKDKLDDFRNIHYRVIFAKGNILVENAFYDNGKPKPYINKKHFTTLSEV